jgi:hypothetical protein
MHAQVERWMQVFAISRLRSLPARMVLVIFVTTIAGTSYGHGPAWHRAATRQDSDQTPAEIGSTALPQRQRLEYYYRLFSEICHRSPLRSQAQTLKEAEAIYQMLHPSNGSAATTAALDHQLEHAQAHYDQLVQQLAKVPVRWNGQTLELADDIRHLRIAAGIARPVLIMLENSTDETLMIRPVQSFAPGTPGPSLTVPGKSTRALLLPLKAGDESINSCQLEFLRGQGQDNVESLVVPVLVQKPAIVRGILRDEQTGKPVAGRVTVESSDGVLRQAGPFADVPTLCEKPVVFRPAWMTLPFFYCDGHFSIRVPPGATRITAARGFETRPVTHEITTRPGETCDIQLDTQRFIDMKQLGWISGDTHIHWSTNSWDENLDLELLKVVQRAEDLRVANNLTLYQWRSPEMGGPFTKPDQKPMGPIQEFSDHEYHMQMAEEYRNDNHYGHINLLNIQQLIQPISTGAGSGGPPGAYDYPLNLTAILAARSQGGISVEAHNLGPYHCSDVPVHVALGLADSLDQLDAEHYYRFLNSGFHIGLSNGSDHPARVVGCCRVYVHTEGPFSYAAWIDGLRQGRTFTTSGPLLFLKVNGETIGRTIDVSSGDALHVQARVVSRRPIGVFQLVSNGDVLKSIRTEATRAEIDVELVANESCWFTVRASRDSTFNAVLADDVAHSSAVYVRVSGREVLDRDAIQFWIANVRQHAERVRKLGKFASDQQRQEALDHIARGQRVYEDLLQQAESEIE